MVVVEAQKVLLKQQKVEVEAAVGVQAPSYATSTRTMEAEEVVVEARAPTIWKRRLAGEMVQGARYCQSLVSVGVVVERLPLESMVVPPSLSQRFRTDSLSSCLEVVEQVVQTVLGVVIEAQEREVGEGLLVGSGLRTKVEQVLRMKVVVEALQEGSQPVRMGRALRRRKKAFEN